MSSPRRALLLPVLLLALLASAPAASAKTIAYDARGEVHKVGQSGATVLYKGHVKSKRLGKAKVTQRLRISGLTATGTFSVRYRGGILRGTVTANASLGLGKATFSGSLRVTGGTGRFAHARGSGTYSGTSSLDLSRATFRQHGTVTY